MNIKCVLALSLLLVNWWLASKHARKNGKIKCEKSERDREGDLLGISKPFIFIFKLLYFMCRSILKMFKNMYPLNFMLFLN